MVAAALLVIAYRSSTTIPVTGYVMTARFGRIDGLEPGSDVRISGIKVGGVIDTVIDTMTYDAVVRFSIDESVKLPVDTEARIGREGLLNGSYLELEPGHETALIAAGGEIPISQTQGPVSVVDMIGRFVFGGRRTKP